MTVGYEARVYTATESQGEVELSISVTEPPTGGALRPFTLTMNMEDGTARMLKNNICHVYIHYTSLERNEDYTASGESIEFHVGDTMRTHTIMINQDLTCEDTNEFFYSSVSLESGTFQITVIQPQVMVIIDDSMEVECGKCRIGIQECYVCVLTHM